MKTFETLLNDARKMKEQIEQERTATVLANEKMFEPVKKELMKTFNPYIEFYRYPNKQHNAITMKISGWIYIDVSILEYKSCFRAYSYDEDDSWDFIISSTTDNYMEKLMKAVADKLVGIA